MNATNINLTNLEKVVLKAIKKNAQAVSGGEFAYGSEIRSEIPHINPLSIPGAIGSLSKKGIVSIHHFDEGMSGCDANETQITLSCDLNEEGEPIFRCLLCEKTVPLSRLTKAIYNGHGISEREGFKFLHGGSCQGKIESLIPDCIPVPFFFHDAIPWSDSAEAELIKDS